MGRIARNVKLHAGCSFIVAAAYLSPEPSLKMLGSRLFCDECQKAGRNQWQKSSSKDFNHTIVFVSFFRLSIILSSSCFTYMESDVLLQKWERWNTFCRCRAFKWSEWKMVTTLCFVLKSEKNLHAQPVCFERHCQENRGGEESLTVLIAIAVHHSIPQN